MSWVSGAISQALVVLAAAVIGQAPADEVAVLDVGQGDSILFQQGSRQILIDGGQGRAVLEQLGREMPWFDRRVEALILTHPDRDHLEGFLHVLERYEVGFVILPVVPAGTDLQNEWLKRLQELKVPYRFARAGETLTAGDLRIDVIGPSDPRVGELPAKIALNKYSTVARAEWHGLSFMFTGDIDAVTEKALLQRVPDRQIKSRVLKVAHHGSKTSTSEEWLQAVAPSLAVISAGKDNRYGHPAKEVLNRLNNLFVGRTDEQGTIRFLWLRDHWWLKTDRAKS